jgi:hypothetical protein
MREQFREVEMSPTPKELNLALRQMLVRVADLRDLTERMAERLRERVRQSNTREESDEQPP